MDKITPKPADVFQANRDRAAPLLKKLRADGIGHVIDGKIVPSVSGATFETKSPVDGSVLASVARALSLRRWTIERISPMVCSATESLLAPDWHITAMPAAVHAVTSIESNPAP